MSRACDHCGLPVPPALLPAEDEPAYCCNGCAAVAAFLSSNGLTGYYRVKQASASEAAPAQTTGRSYDELDDPAFAERYVRREGEEGALASVELYLEGVHCAACVWLVEKLPRLLPGVIEARLELSRGIARVTYAPQQVQLSAVARAIDGLGYPVHPFRGASLAERRRSEDRAALTRLAIAGALAGNVMLVSFATYGGILHGIEGDFAALFRWLALALTVPAVFGPGRVFLRGAWASLTTRTPHVDLPVAVALLVGLIGGALNTLRGAGEVYFDTVSVLVFLLLAGRWLQQRQRRQAADAAELLASLAPSSARRVTSEGEQELTREVPLEVLAAGDVVEVRAGERIPADGEVVSGRSRVDAALLTGESRPVPVEVGERVHAGTVNRSAPLRVRVETTGEETRVGTLLRQVAEQSQRKAPVVAWANRVAGVFVSAVLVLAVVTFALWQARDPLLALDHAVALLIVTCPCALGLATPLAIHAALGRAARLGAIVKGGDVLQRLAGSGGTLGMTGAAPSDRRVFLDKTGTLSEGRHRLETWEVAAGVDLPALEAALLGLENASNHPVAEAFRAHLAPLHTPTPLEGEVSELPGGGLAATLGGRLLRAGSPEALRRAGLEPDAQQRATLAALLARAQTPVLIGWGERCVAVAGLGDPLRAGAREALDALREAGFRPTILSGDHPEVVAAAAAELEIPDAHGGLSPEDKLAWVERARAEGAQVIMVGDGVNDAAALAAADVGIGVHGGSEATLAAADVFLSRPGIAPLAELVDLSHDTLGRIRLSLLLSLGYNVTAAILAMAGVINPLVAAVLMPLSSLTVIANSYRAGRARRPVTSEREAPLPAPASGALVAA